jgi:hypothetical protein
LLCSFCAGQGTGVKKRSERGIYLTSSTASSSLLPYLIKRCRSTGLNTIVIDAKFKLVPPVLEAVKKYKLFVFKPSPNPWLKKICDELHREGFIVSVRIVTFKDDWLALARPDLAIKKGGGFYFDYKSGRWVSPYAYEVRLYEALIAEIAAMSGADEVQFDYIRFPAEGNIKNLTIPFEDPKISRSEIIVQFLKEVRERLKKYNTSLAVDIFGITAWQTRIDIEILGQDLELMAPHIDVLSPMFYPSHFSPNFEGCENPADHPYKLMRWGVRLTKRIVTQESVSIVPWLQGFDLLVTDFTPDYIRQQVRAIRDEGIKNFLVWNASNNYGYTFAAFR